MKMTFNLPDLGEGLAEAEIVSWQAKEGDQIKMDEPLVSVETAKAVVDVPSPYSGKIIKLHAKAGDILEVGKPLVDFELEAEAETGASAGTSPSAKPATAEEKRDDSGTVVGAMPSGEEELVDQMIIRRKNARVAKGQPKAAPAARALAKANGIDLENVPASGHHGQITRSDVKRFIEHGATEPPTVAESAASAPGSRPPIRHGIPEPLRGPRRAMAQSMTVSRDRVTPTSLFDDADIHYWTPRQDVTVRVIRSIVSACEAEPALNAWYDDQTMERTLFSQIDLALAVDTPDGLIVPVIRAADRMPPETLRQELNRLKEATRTRKIAPTDMKDPTITLSNFGMLAGRYASPVIIPPQVAIIGVGGTRHDVVPVLGGIEVHKRLPLSLTFDHRCVTGGEACRFLGAMIADLEKME